MTKYDDDKLAKSYRELIESGDIKDINDIISFTQVGDSFEEIDPIIEITAGSLDFKEKDITNLDRFIVSKLDQIQDKLIEIESTLNHLKD